MFWNIILGIASYALQLILAPKPQNAKAAALEDFDAPVAEEGLEIPDVFGTEVLRSPNVVWYGDLGIEDIKGARRYGFFGPRQVIGHKYALGMQMVLCSGPADKVTEIRVADKVAFQGENTGTQIEIDEPDLFGGDQGEGGIIGAVDVEMGGPTQDANDYLTGAIDGLMPAFRGVVSLVLRQVELGNNTYIKPWEVTLQRIYKVPGTGADQWYPDKAGIPRTRGSRHYAVPNTHDTPIANKASTLDVAGSYIGQITNSHGELQIISVETGTVVATITLGYEAQGILASTPTEEFLIWKPDGDFEVRDSATGALKDTVTGGGSLVSGQSLDLGHVRVVDDLTYMAYEQLVTLHLYVNDGSGWAHLDSVGRGFFFGGLFNAITMSDDRMYAAYGDAKVSYWPWDASGFTGGRVTPSLIASTLSSGTGSAIAIQYIGYHDATDSLIIIGTNSRIWRFSADGETLLDSYTGSSEWDAASSRPNYTSSNAFLSGSSLYFHVSDDTAPSVDRIFVFNVSTLTKSSEYASTLWSESEWADTSRTLYVSSFNALVMTHGNTADVYFLGGVLDMNPAHIIRECITARMGYVDADLEDDDEAPGFTYAADTLYDETFGLTLKWAREEEIGEFINMVLAHIDAYLYTSRRTGKFNLKLVRNDYDIDEIPVVTEDDVVEWSEVSRRGLADAVNSVTVRYTDRLSRGKDASHQVDNIAQMQQMDGQRVSVTRNYPGISTGNLAVRVARRDVKSLGIGMISGRIVCKRTVESWINPGEPFRLVSARHNLSGEVMRVAEIEFGDGRDNRIIIKFVQDVFGINDDELVDTAASDWENPANPPQAVSPRLVWEMPYRQLVAFAGTAEANSALTGDPDFGAVEAAGAKPTQDTSQAIISVKKNSGSYVDRDIMTFAPAGFLDGAIDEQAATLTLTDASALSLITVGSLAVIDGNDRDLMEVIRIDAVDGLDLDISRGFLDTIPKAHADAAELVVFDDFTQGDGEPYTDTDTVSVKLRPTTPLGTLSLSAAPTNTLDMDSRAVRPLRPADCQVDGTGYGTVDVSGLNPIPTSWARRNRLSEIATPKAWDDADVSPEASQTTTIRLLDPGGVVINDTTYTGIAGTTQDIDPADFGGASSGLIEFVAVRGGYESWQSYRLAVIFTEALLFEGDEQGGTDVLDLEGTESGDLLLEGST